MRLILLAAVFGLGLVPPASAQPASRFAVGPVSRLDRVSVEGGASGTTAVFGAVTSFKASTMFQVEAELTWATNRLERSYEGWFISYTQDPNATREEIERLAPRARRALGYKPGIGGSAALVARRRFAGRASVAARAGVSGRRYTETSAYTILSIPAGVDPDRVARDFESTSSNRTRGGLLLGLEGSVALTDRLSLAPELRYVYGGPARVGNKHRELGIGARALWQF
jgi:hypothetical protein